MTRAQLYAALKRALEVGDDPTDLIEEWIRRFGGVGVPPGTYNLSRTLVV